VQNRFLRYTRTVAGNESRLHGRMSIGLGGHVDLSDVICDGDRIDLEATINKASDRELTEELGNLTYLSRDWIGTIIDNETDVGRVHVGVVAVWELQKLPASVEDAIGDVSLCSLDEIEAAKSRLERWSEMLLAPLANYFYGAAGNVRAA